MSEPINKNEPNDLEIQKRREAATQRLRQHYIEAFEKHESLFPQAEAELKRVQAQQKTTKSRSPKPARRPSAKHATSTIKTAKRQNKISSA